LNCFCLYFWFWQTIHW